VSIESSPTNQQAEPRTVERAEQHELAVPLSVSGGPLVWLRLEAGTLLVTALVLFASTHESWWLLPAGILLPDLLMAGYLGGPRVGAATYNAAHSYPLPAALSLVGLSAHHPLILALGLIWLAHIGMDRALGYGLKYGSDFTHTHLGNLASHPHN
jgi:hypothetical protein